MIEQMVHSGKVMQHDDMAGVGAKLHKGVGKKAHTPLFHIELCIF